MATRRRTATRGRRGDGSRAVGQLRQPRLAEMIASILRERIVSGHLQGGDLLPKQDDLLDEFRVSRPSIREALRILETEGLVTVRRGNVGGATVQGPSPESAGYMFGLVLQSRRVALRDLAMALRYIEPICAELCAERPDRQRAVIPALRKLCAAAEEAVGSGVRFTELSRRFHERMVASCGNETIILLVGALERLWSEQERQWAARAERAGGYPAPKLRREVLKTHKQILDAIAAGDAQRAGRIARRHLDTSQRYTLAGAGSRIVRATPLRGT